MASLQCVAGRRQAKDHGLIQRGIVSSEGSSMLQKTKVVYKAQAVWDQDDVEENSAEDDARRDAVEGSSLLQKASRMTRRSPNDSALLQDMLKQLNNINQELTQSIRSRRRALESSSSLQKASRMTRR